MLQWRVVFLMDGVHSEQIVTATGGLEAEKLVKSQYAGHKVVIMFVTIYHGK